MLAFIALLATLVPQTQPHGTRIAQVTPSPIPTMTASTLPSVAPSASAPTTPKPTAPAYKYRFVPRNSTRAGEPTIYAVYMNDKKLHSLGQIIIKVATSHDVVRVVSRSNGREGILPLIAPGDFEATSTLPKIPFIAAGMTVEIEFIATSATGRSAIVRVPVLVN